MVPALRRLKLSQLPGRVLSVRPTKVLNAIFSAYWLLRMFLS